MEKILLIHGAWHNGNCWKSVEKFLNEKGYETEALTLPGNGENDSKEVSYEDYINYVSEVIRRQDKPVVVVGHSSAGHVIQQAVPKAKENVKKIIFNNAWILPDGKAQFDFVPDEIKMGMRQEAAKGDGSIPIDPGFVRGMLATNADDETFNNLMAILVTQPLVIMETEASTKEFEKLQIPMALLYCNKDISVPEGAYVGMFKALGDNPVVEIACDHEGLFTNPKLYAQGLIDAINK